MNKLLEKNTVDSCYLEYSVSRTLLNHEQFVRSLVHSALDQSKKLAVSSVSIFQIFAYVE